MVDSDNLTELKLTSCPVLHYDTHDPSRAKGFKLGSLNIILSEHIDELQVFLKDGVIDILAINEFKLDHDRA